MNSNIREIPYNYTSFSDREIVLRLLNEDAWHILNKLRSKRRTGRSARMLFDILGDMWIIKRNPYIQDDLINNKRRRQQLYQSFQSKIQQINQRRGDNQDSLILVEALKKAVNTFNMWLDEQDTLRKKIGKQLRKATHHSNICFDGLSRVSHVTDATDWRVELPFVVATPKNELEIINIVKAGLKLDMNIIPRGGGTGYTGACIPLTENSLIINTEKLTDISKIKYITLPGTTTEYATITAGAGVITDQLSKAASKLNLIFAVDPTSQDSSTIGGNVATNAGGKKAVMWGTTLDNLVSWQMVMPNGHLIKIERQQHNCGKIHDVPISIFEVSDLTDDSVDTYTIKLTAEETRKPGLGKDVTNKILGKIPGVQKEGCDGIITSATFILHPKNKFTHTVCMEFFSADMHESVPAIVEVVDLIKQEDQINLIGLEHLDSRYIKAIGYSSKSSSSKMPKMILLADIACDTEDPIIQITKQIKAITSKRNAEIFVATTPQSREQFWADRKRTAAIAAHTNAFKINEDVVIPLDKLADYSNQIELINIELSISNKIEIITDYKKIISQHADLLSNTNELQKIHLDKINSLQDQLDQTLKNWQIIFDNLDQKVSKYKHLFGDCDQNTSIFRAIQTGKEVISLRKSIQVKINEYLNGSHWSELREQLEQSHKNLRNRRIFIATHMHAGDGNVHTNIPVHSNDYKMLHKADEVVDRIMKIAQDLGGVISGEHGIGLTKIKYLEPENIQHFIGYKQQVDPNDNFNRHKLTKNDELNNAYTPSLRLLEMEAIILEESDLGELNNSIKDCLRCGKCKPVCTTHVPNANLLYSPRNKILATGLLTEAFLYEEQTKRGISSKHFEELNDIADHCTICHRCYNPCPVNIDFGDVTILIKKLLRSQGKRKFNIGSTIGMMFLNISGHRAINIARTLMIRLGYSAQRIASKFITHQPSMPNTISKSSPKSQLVHFLKDPMPSNIPPQTMRAMLNIEDKNIIPIIRNHKKCDDSSEAVFYFPGCGSERLFSQIGLGVLKWLYELNIQTIVPPGYLCCGYPQSANGETNKAHQIITDNRVLFHRIAKNVDFLNITYIVVSCGTCLDQLLEYEMKQVFPNAVIIDIHELLLKKGISIESEKDDYLFHEPCHTPTKSDTGAAISSKLLQTNTIEADRCCGESGTFAVARPDIAAQVKFRKVEELKLDLQKISSPDKQPKILTSCPACLQGLERLENKTGLKADYAMLEMAKIHFGDDWANDFIEQLDKLDIEKILL